MLFVLISVVIRKIKNNFSVVDEYGRSEENLVGCNYSLVLSDESW